MEMMVVTGQAKTPGELGTGFPSSHHSGQMRQCIGAQLETIDVHGVPYEPEAGHKQGCIFSSVPGSVCERFSDSLQSLPVAR